ncbi:Pilus assembly protein, PilO [Enhygromyxa salina]|uniref:Pilus assembly protein, PilO n=1 Tax=Enhygromyxa salina TaxID=215803 RepID=A0A2S9XB57_9BACT|nr:type 4a pilus biogenesis protein PilO [Enhygromyxa salina]PRP90083.1 Pilus assembly protein, PilO [Enhygromyxa salina]
MAESTLDRLEKYPAWQLGLAWLLGAGLVLGGWYFLYFSDILAAKAQAESGVSAAEASLAKAKDNLTNYEQRVKEQAERDKELQKTLEVVPVDSSTIDHLMSTFQREARGVGLGIEAWSPQPEEFHDFYAKIPVEVTALGSWHEIGEFFRRVSDMKQIVNIEEVKMKVGKDFDESGFPLLAVDFTASAFRLLTDDEQAGKGEGATRRSQKGAKR